MYSKDVLVEWDPPKAAANCLKHGVHFAEASDLLQHDYAMTIPDDEAIGENLRIISARCRRTAQEQAV